MGRDQAQAFLQASGISVERIERIKELATSGRTEEAERELSDEDLDKYCIAGTPEECVDGLQRLTSLRVSTACRMLQGSPNVEEAIRLFAREIV